MSNLDATNTRMPTKHPIKEARRLMSPAAAAALHRLAEEFNAAARQRNATTGSPEPLLVKFRMTIGQPYNLQPVKPDHTLVFVQAGAEVPSPDRLDKTKAFETVELVAHEGNHFLTVYKAGGTA